MTGFPGCKTAVFYLLSSCCLFAQSFSVLVYESNQDIPIEFVEVRMDGVLLGLTNALGILNIPLDKKDNAYSIDFSKLGYFTFSTQITNIKEGQTIVFRMSKEVGDYAEIATVTLDEGEGSDNRDSEVYSLLAASRDPLLQAGAFQFGIFRFRNRGIDNLYNQLGYEGFLLNDAETGFIPFLIFSGQNQITRYSENSMSYQVEAEDFGSAGLNQWIQFDPRTYRQGLHLNYSVSNRSFTTRLGLQYVRHWGKQGISLLAGANRRWADAGIFQGSFYNAFGSYLGVRKELGKRSGLTFLGIYSPVERGKNSPGVSEVYDLSGDPLYNSYWGNQAGQIRNSRVARSSFPTFFLNFNSQFSSNLAFYGGLMVLKGKRSDSSIDWYNVADPRPDYYQKLPSYVPVTFVKDSIESLWENNESIRQVNWDRIYQVNRSNYRTIYNVNGTDDSLSGNRSLYILSERYNNPTDIESFIRAHLKWGQFQMNGGYRIEYTTKENYLQVGDLLGGDFFLDKENFILDQSKADPDIAQRNKLVRQGDKYGYHYSSNTWRNSLFANLKYRSSNWDFQSGIKLAMRSDQRISYFENSIFDHSIGSSERIVGFQYHLKSAATFKVNGRNYLRASVATESLAPNFEQIFINPAWRPDVIPNLENTIVYHSEIGYFYRSPSFKIQIGAFFSRFENQIRNRDFFLDEALVTDSDNNLASGGLINGFYTGLDQQHIGIEFFAQQSFPMGFDVLLGGQFGRYVYCSRPEFLIFDQFGYSFSSEKIYLLNFYVPNTPQHVLTTGLKYNFKRNGFAQINISYADRNFVEINPLRRTVGFVENVERTDPLFRQIIDQEKLPSYLVVDCNIFKSFRIRDRFFSVSLALNNILNKTGMRSGGFEQNRLNTEDRDIGQFPNKYFNLQGFNFFINLNLSLN
ncbi:MAG: hypothetical protein IPM48_11385 [Saprospiraceae bacterium]|nr:hypothetical protein [Saprospiraceae bacterium]